MTIRVGILGAGRIGRIHAENVLQTSCAQLVSICDPLLDAAWINNLDIPLATTSENDFFSLNLDAIIIASPTTEHYRHSMRAIESEAHVFCEKPVDKTVAAHQEIRTRLRSFKRKFQVGFNRRYDKDFSTIARASERGNVGKPYLVRITSRDPGLPSYDYLATSGGMFLDMTIHDFDMARFIMKSPVTEVYARGCALVDEQLMSLNDIDTAVITLKFANGAFGVIDNSRQAVYGYDQRVELFGSLGSVTNDHHYPTSVIATNAAGCQQEPMLNFFLERYQQSYREELQAFFASIIRNTHVHPTIDDALLALELAMAAQESLQTNQPVKVTIS